MASKAQAALAKIIAIISTVLKPSQVDCGPDPDATAQGKRGLGVDLNLKLGTWPDEDLGSEEEGGGCGFTSAESSVESGVVFSSEKKGSVSLNDSEAGDALTVEKSSQGECEPEEGEGETRKGMEGGGKEYSEITNIPAEPEEERERSEGHLDLLLEAVRQASAGVYTDGPEEKESETSKRSKRRGACCSSLELYEDSGPVVRSKRGRNQALPSRYRDSVLEPWRKMPTITRFGRAAKP
ncbi:hypothetical protein J5N97_021410 [Dioscorea zingiberensis]|uniref:Uncharacterized protein n=1 Tax=Dioscorea zingiberensis TaxID=325984 RepID=A0A9D5CHT0_9LILI|nr:hypothetical protein J5N97_021410 [Dioscorea zingiberensis]